MKVIQINAVCSQNSTGRTCQELNDGLIRLGHEGIVLYGNGTSQYEFARKVSGNLEVKIHGLLSRIFGKNAAYSPFATRKMLRIMEEYQPDVVHLHNLHGNYVNLKALLKYLAKHDIATVITVHDCWVFTGKCTHYTADGCYRWQTGCHNCPRLEKDIPSCFFDRTGEMWAEKKQLWEEIPRLAVTGVSDWITEEAKKSFLSKAGIVCRIYNGIDLDVFYPRTGDFREHFGIAEDKFTILCVGAGWEEGSSKTKDLLSLAERLDENCQIVLAGSVPFADKLPQNIHCVGYVSSKKELAKLYSACNVYVHLSREDTFGKVIAEALACGTPAVVYNATACPELVGEGCGYVVEPGDVDAVFHAVKEIQKVPKDVYSPVCAEFVAKNFPKEKLIEDTLELYHSVCKL